MQMTSPVANPFEWWAKANMDAMAMSMQLASAAAASMTAIWPTSALETIDRPAAAPATAASRLGERPTSEVRTSTAKSWYRAPYRSPFDPMFWMMPGHPVDHIGDWIGPAMAVSASFGNPLATAYSSAPTPWSNAPWMPSATAWFDNLLPRHAAGGASTTNNVVDFESAYAAYRTAGGHAAAQMIKSVSAMPAPASSVSSFGLSNNPWVFPYGMFPWSSGRF